MLRSEVVEILFSKGVVKVLFATETFAMVSLALYRNAMESDLTGSQHACQISRLFRYP
jgi:hypothetical protein